MTALDHDDPGELEEALIRVAPEERLGLDLGGEEQVWTSGGDELTSCAAAIGQQRPDRREVDGDERISLPCQLDRPGAGSPERVAEERVRREVDQLDAVEPLGMEVVGSEAIRRAAIRHERPFTAGDDEDADAARSSTRDSRRPDGDAVALELLDERSAGTIATDGAHELRLDPEAREPAGRVRRRPALPNLDPTRDVGASFDRATCGEDDIEHQVPKDEGPSRRRSRADPDDRGCHAADGKCRHAGKAPVPG
jgi:hypothetical protein